ncbi:hypothetical protein BGW41_004706 [Actinomortierella wolfii]|nr:hypothetical protein BGW41_004706 [Actinomortierella wolfii]
MRQRHLLRSHDDDDNDMTDILKCDQLSSDSQSAANMENSERSLPSEPRVVYMCPEVSCNVFFITVQELAAHMSEKEHGHCPLDPQKGVIKNASIQYILQNGEFSTVESEDN